MKREHQRALERVGDDIDREAARIRMGITCTYNMMLAKTMQEIIPTLNDRQRDILREKGYCDLTENVQNIANCAMLLAVNYVKLATSYAESCGGGGVSTCLDGNRRRMRMMSDGGYAVSLRLLQWLNQEEKNALLE